MNMNIHTNIACTEILRMLAMSVWNACFLKLKPLIKYIYIRDSIFRVAANRELTLLNGIKNMNPVNLIMRVMLDSVVRFSSFFSLEFLSLPLFPATRYDFAVE